MDTKPERLDESAARFKAYRRKTHISQRELSEQIGVCRQTVSEIECGVVVPHESTWSRFSQLEGWLERPPILHVRRIITPWQSEPDAP